ncbi:MAG: CHRD domain-containing protein [Myxococcota bacterium]
MPRKWFLAVTTGAASVGAAAIWAAAGIGPTTAYGGSGGLQFNATLVTIPRTNSVATGRIDASFNDRLDELTLSVTHKGLATAITGASIHASDPRGEVGPAVLDLFDPGSCTVTGGRTGSINCTVTDADLYPCAACGIGGVAIDSLEDLAFAMEAGLVSVNVRGQTVSTLPSLEGAELYGDMKLGISRHFSGCQNKDIPGGSIHLASCTTGTWRPGKNVNEWNEFEQDFDWSGGGGSYDPEGGLR